MADDPSSAADEAHERLMVAIHLQKIEGNPLSPDEIAMFEMFEREGWSHERRRAYILAKLNPLAAE
jgi:hypothetical protein